MRLSWSSLYSSLLVSPFFSCVRVTRAREREGEIGGGRLSSLFEKAEREKYLRKLKWK